MRWQVEVSNIGKDGFDPYTVEADSWQRALQAARKLRGDESPMSGFSIELLNDGCRAVDPAARVRYEVERTRDGAPLSAGAEALAESGASSRVRFTSYRTRDDAPLSAGAEALAPKKPAAAAPAPPR